MTAEDKLHLIEYETAKFLSSIKKLGYESVYVTIHNAELPKTETPSKTFADSDSSTFNVYDKCNKKLTLFEYV